MFLNKSILINLYKYKRKLSTHWQSITTQQRSAATQTTVKGQDLKILFFGTDNFSLPSLKVLHKNSNSVQALATVTSFKSPANCIRVYSEAQQLPLHRWPIDVELCRQYDLGVVVSFGHLIPERMIKAFPYGMINVHASLLPRWRGAAPIIYAIMHGDAVTGITIMKIEPKRFDIGDILAQRQVPIKPGIFMPELHALLANEGADLLIKVVNDFPDRLRNAQKQNNAAATFAPKITTAITDVNFWELSAQQLYNRFRALYGFKHLTARFQNKNVQLIEIHLPASAPTTSNTLREPGDFVFQYVKKCLLVRCASNTYIEVQQLRIEGKKVMNAVEFNNGYLKKIGIAEHLFTNNNQSVICS